MQYQASQREKLMLSPLGLGTWAMSNVSACWGKVDDTESIRTIGAAIDGGVTFFDTAPIYGLGHAERILGQAVSHRRDEVTLATKCGLVPRDDGRSPPRRCLRRESVIAECEASLSRLKTDRIDLLQCHWPDPETPMGETVESLKLLREQGKIRCFGVSNFSCDQVLAAREFGPVISLQSPYSLIDRSAEATLIPFCKQHDIALIAYSPLYKGLLAGHLRAGDRLCGVRRKDGQFSGRRFEQNLNRVARLKKIASNYGRTTAQLALRWVMQRDGVSCALMGAKTCRQLRENLAALDFEITPEDQRLIERLFGAG